MNPAAREAPDARIPGASGEHVGLWHDAEGFEDPNIAETSYAPQDTHHDSNAHPSLQAIFNAVHARSKKRESEHKHLTEHGFDVPVKVTHLFKRPVVRQWLFKGNLFREQDERIPSRFELFFDLMFVGIAHVVAEGAAGDSSGFNVLKFVMEFFPTWSVWFDVRTFLNVHGTDDITERLGLLGIMVLLSGYSANAAALEIFHCGPPQEVLARGGQCTEVNEALGKRATGDSVQNRIAEYYVGAGYWFGEDYERLIRSAIAFYLIWRLFRTLLYVYYGFALPKFRSAMWTNAVVKVLTSVFYFPILALWDPGMIVGLMFAGMAAETLNGFLSLGLLWFQNEIRVRREKEPLYIPALSQEHAIERIVLFVLVVVGEMIISSTYIADEHTARIVVGVLITLLPIMRDNWPTHEFLAVCAGMLAALVVFETVSKVGAVGRRFDEKNAALVRRAKLTTLSRRNPAEMRAMKEARAQLRAMGVVESPPLPDVDKPTPEDEPLRPLRLRRTLSWHPYDGLTLGETGEEDVGMEGELGHLEMKELSAGQSWAFAA
ncbi:hypothetical protein MBRA1_002623 [Malassezia brasiliensis]|uniref:Uncharacterized protein n=1 Tax=Malassezia brasiliensis TaxID=1821822 RepID=A0AAF0DV50_9BASI|nr:hypothetical protein MBRA1_002623 [Malassezia brasiliensis]